jgi:hypothetical protein
LDHRGSGGKEAFMNVLPIGQYVKHYRYGFGIIVECDAENTSIEFELGGIKKFVTRLMDVELSDFTPPERFRSKWVRTAPASRPTHTGRPGRPAPRPAAAAARSGRS